MVSKQKRTAANARVGRAVNIKFCFCKAHANEGGKVNSVLQKKFDVSRNNKKGLKRLSKNLTFPIKNQWSESYISGILEHLLAVKPGCTKTTKKLSGGKERARKEVPVKER